MPSDSLYQPSVQFWSFVWMCITAGYENTRDFFHADVQTMIVGAILLILGYLLFAFRRGRKAVADRAIEDWLLTFAPLGIAVAVIFIFNLLRSPHLVYKAEHEQARSALNQAKADESGKDTEIANLKTEIDALASPGLQGEITQFIVGLEPKHPKTCELSVMATISNIGAPSIAKHLHLGVYLSDGTPIPLIPRLAPPEKATLLGGPNDKRSMVLQSKDYLPLKTMNEPIPRGGAVPGFLIAEVENCDKPKIDALGTKVQFSFQDVNGKWYTTAMAISDSNKLPFPY